VNSYSIAILLYYTFFKRFVPVLVLVVFVLEASGVPSEVASEVASEVGEMDMLVVAAVVAAEPYSSCFVGIWCLFVF